MRKQLVSSTMLCCGMLALVLSFVLTPMPQAASAMPNLQPSPRPTLVPTDGPSPTPLPPTSTPLPPTSTPTGPEPTTPPVPTEESNPRNPTPTPIPGRLTGTVIDLRTSAPAPNVAVRVGDWVFVTDQNGNYDAQPIPSGYYLVGLQLASGQGDAAQGEAEYAVGAGDTVVVHLFFYSALPAGLPVEPQPQPTQPILPTSTTVPPSAQLPDLDLPDTQPVAAAPVGLPVTAAGDTSALPFMLLLLSTLLLGGGVFLQVSRYVFVPTNLRKTISDEDILCLLLGLKDEDILRKLLDL
ncbi:carboxypeptidase regulatory-like domain-containing protein [Candidatus Gracilibacteria bacterium]|nr:carboxypeptidase regulatory-like domain-containing protein [Candidatus Gracilibacteria bacterium]